MVSVKDGGRKVSDIRETANALLQTHLSSFLVPSLQVEFRIVSLKTLTIRLKCLDLNL